MLTGLDRWQYWTLQLVTNPSRFIIRLQSEKLCSERLPKFDIETSGCEDTL